MTARLATHADVAARTHELFERLAAAGVDPEPISDRTTGQGRIADPLRRVLEGSADLALVGLRALRGTAADGLTMLAALPREDPRDVLVVLESSPTPLRSLRPGARVGVKGPRRQAFLTAHRPDVVAVPIADGFRAELVGAASGLDAVILGSTEARGAGLGGRIGEVLDPRSWLPEVGQGIVALMARHPLAEVTALDHLPTRLVLRAELALLDALDPGPDAAYGSLAQPSGRLLRLWAAVATIDGRRLVRSDLTGPVDEPELLGASVAKQLMHRGADLVFEGALS